MLSYYIIEMSVYNKSRLWFYKLTCIYKTQCRPPMTCLYSSLSTGTDCKICIAHAPRNYFFLLFFPLLILQRICIYICRSKISWSPNLFLQHQLAYMEISLTSHTKEYRCTLIIAAADEFWHFHFRQSPLVIRMMLRSENGMWAGFSTSAAFQTFLWRTGESFKIWQAERIPRLQFISLRTVE